MRYFKTPGRRCPVLLLVLLAPLLVGIFCSSAAFAMVDVVLPANVTPGQPFVAEINSDTPLGDVFVEWNGKSVPVEMRHIASANQTDQSTPVEPGWQGVVLLGVPYGRKGDSVSLKITTVGSGGYKAYERSIPVVLRTYPEQRLTVQNKYVELAQKDLDRHNAERARVLKALSGMNAGRLWTLPFMRPVPGDLSSAYGLTRYFNDKPRSPHKGIDLRGAAGTPIHACAEGTVVLAEPHFFSGNSVYIDHGQGVVSMYFHMSGMDVAVGQRVHRGEVIGKVGQTGRVTGPHLHFGISLQGELIDPTPLLTEN